MDAADAEQHWSLESLNKAYQAAIPAAAWEAGWDDGQALQQRTSHRHSA